MTTRPKIRGNPKRKPPGTRTIGYEIKGEYSEAEAEKILKKALATRIITEFDSGRGKFMWFEGPPSESLRKLRDELQRLADAGVVFHKGRWKGKLNV